MNRTRRMGLISGIAAATVAVLLLGRIVQADDKKAITYSRDVSRIIQRKCQSCHRADGVAPFSLTNFEQVKEKSATIRTAVLQNRMPPWLADPKHGKFVNDRSLTTDEKTTFISWLDGGAVKGDEKELPPPASFPKGWSIGDPDLVLSMPKEFDVPAEGVLDYQRFVVDPGFKQDRWVERSEAKPGCKAVHHILVYIVKDQNTPLYDPTGNTALLCGQAPGDMPTILEPGNAVKIPAGSKLIFEIHYTPLGKPMKDRSSIGLIFAKQPAKREVKTNILIKPFFSIPPNDPSHVEEAVFTFPKPIRIVSLMPHMHFRGKSFEYRIVQPDGKSETILTVPRYDFNWQSIYRFADPPVLLKGAKLQCIATWDNSKNNPANPDPNKRVTFGLQTWDEMMNGWMGYTVED